MTATSAPLGDLAAITSGFAFKSSEFNTTGDGLPLIRIRDVVSGRSETFYSGDFKPDHVIENGDALIGMDGEFNLAKWRGGRALLNQRVCKVEAKDERLNQEYLVRLLPKALKEIEARTPFVTVKHLSVKELRAVEIPLPPLPEQRRIAAILDQADALRAKRRAAIAKCDQLLQSVFLEMFGDPVTNPQGWPTHTLGDLVKFTGGSQPAKKYFTDTPAPDRVRLVQIRDFRTDKYPTYIPKELARRPFTRKDVMVGRYGPPVFQIFRGLEGSYNVALMKAEPKSMLDTEFLFHLLKNDSIQRAVISNSQRSAGQSGVNLDFLSGLTIGTPPIELQQRFANSASALQFQVDRLEAQSSRISEFFSALQQRAFTGQLSPAA